MPSTPAPGQAADTRPADTPRARRIRLVGILALGALTVVVVLISLRSSPSSREPASAFEYIRDQALAGDGRAAWRILLPEGREKYRTFLKAMATSDDETAQYWRRLTGVSRKDVQTMSPEDLIAREYLSVTETMLRGARVYRTDMVNPDMAIIYILARDGQERSWIVKRVDGIWQVSDPLPKITANGDYWAGPGTQPIKVPQPATIPPPRGR